MACVLDHSAQFSGLENLLYTYTGRSCNETVPRYVPSDQQRYAIPCQAKVCSS